MMHINPTKQRRTTLIYFYYSNTRTSSRSQCTSAITNGSGSYNRQYSSSCQSFGSF